MHDRSQGDAPPALSDHTIGAGREWEGQTQCSLIHRKTSGEQRKTMYLTLLSGEVPTTITLNRHDSRDVPFCFFLCVFVQVDIFWILRPKPDLV